MTQAKPQFSSFEEYLAGQDDGQNNGQIEGRFAWINGELVELPPESEWNDFIANYLMVLLATAGIVPLRLIRPHTCEIQVAVLESRDPANRFPDLVILRPEHLELMGKRLTLTREMPPPQLIVEVVSPGKTNRDRDYLRKRAQYAERGVPEYWLIDPDTQIVTVLELRGDQYAEFGVFAGEEAIASPTLGRLAIAAGRLMTI